MPKCDFNEVTLHGCSLVNLLHISRKPFLKNTSEWLLLDFYHYLTKVYDSILKELRNQNGVLFLCP